MRSIEIPNFDPHPLIRGGHFQTIAGQFSPIPKFEYPTTSHLFPMPDGDQLAVDETEPISKVSLTSPILIVFHGLSGSSMSLYARHLAHKLAAKGIRVLRVNHRGCGASLKTSSGIYHAGSFHDVHTVVSAIAKLWSHAAIRVVGFSLSGNMVLNWVASEEYKAHIPSQVLSVLAVSSPIQLELCSLALSKLHNVHFDQFFTRSLIRDAKSRGIWPVSLTLPKDRFWPWLTLRDFDEILTAPKGGFKSRTDYYEKCSAFPRLGRINVPTLVLSAKDDPFVPYMSYADAKWSSSTSFKLLSSGGHMGFISRKKTSFGDYRWMDAAVYAWFTHQL